MRKILIAANWKMNKTAKEGTDLIQNIKSVLASINQIESIIFPPFTSLESASKLLAETGIGLGAQDMYFEESGAFTGEISPLMIKEFGDYVILGHSERRQIFLETDEIINRKVKTALQFGLKPIVCIGENLEQNEKGQTESFITNQLIAALKGTNNINDIVIAYEPIWAIGTGKAAGATEAGKTALLIRNVIRKLYGKEASEGIRILYGGSVKPSNIKDFIREPDIDGALVGGASLKAESFIGIIKACL